MRVVALSSLLTICLISPALGYTVIEHAGASDPTTEGWSATAFVNTSAGPVLDDQGSGVDAWFVDDDGTAIGDVGWYRYELTGQQVAQAEHYGMRPDTPRAQTLSSQG